VPEERRERLFPTLLAVFQGPDGEFAGLHGTVVTEDGQKAPVREPKIAGKVRGGTLSGAAIRLFEPGPILGVTEGIEKAWAVRLATGMPVWPGSNSALLGSMVIPPEVLRVVIWADYDCLKILTNEAVFEPGRVAAERLRARLQAQYRATEILYPTVLGARGKDWEDVWHTLGASGFPTLSRGVHSFPTVWSLMQRWRESVS
jgi:putative DNA primase/helicase